MSDDGGWTRRSSRYLFESQWFKLRQDEVTLPDGQPITYTLIETGGYAMVVPLFDDGTVLLERIYRYPVQATTLECPSGGLDHETPHVAAQRELREETGWEAGRLEPLGSFYGSDGISNECFYVFLATDLTDTGEPSREPTEQMELVRLPLEEATAMAMAGEIADAPSGLSLILAQHHLRERSEPSAIRTSPIAVAEAQGLRRRALRAHQPPDASVYPLDAEAETLHLGAFDGAVLVATGSIFHEAPPGGDDPTAWRIRGMTTAPPLRGRGYGSAILDGLVAHAVSRAGRRVWFNARSSAIPFYAHHGFETEGEPFELPGIGPHLRMAKDVAAAET